MLAIAANHASRSQIASAHSILLIFKIEVWITIFSLNCNCLGELEWITKVHTNYKAPFGNSDFENHDFVKYNPRREKVT